MPIRSYDPFNLVKPMPAISSTPFQNEVTQASEQYGVDPNLINAVMRAESNYDPNVISPAGAQGLMQLMGGTAKDLGVEDPFDPGQNIRGGTQYLSQLMKQHGGDIDRTLASYNWGPGNVRRMGMEGMPPETQEYLKRVKGFMGEEPSAMPEVPSAVRTFDPFKAGKISKETDSESLGEKVLKGVGTASMAATQFGLGVMNWTTRVFGSDIPHTLMGWADPKYIHALMKGGLSEGKDRYPDEEGKAYRERMKAQKFVKEKQESISEKRKTGYDIADILFSIPSDHPIFGFKDIEEDVHTVMKPVEWTLEKLMWPGHKIVDTLIDKEKDPNAHAMFTSVSELATFKFLHMGGKEAKWQQHKSKVRSRLKEHLENASVEDVKKVSEAGGLSGLAETLKEMEVEEGVPYIGDQYDAIRTAEVVRTNNISKSHIERQKAIKEALDAKVQPEKAELEPKAEALRTDVTPEEFMAEARKEVPDAEKITQAVREIGKEERIEREAKEPVRVRDIEEGREKAEGEEVVSEERRKEEVAVGEERRVGERREDVVKRKLVDEMTVEEKDYAIDELRRENEELTIKVDTDPLTGVKSRGWFNERIAEIKTSGIKVAHVFMDLIGFKDINDRLGHAAGDKMLKNIGEAMNELKLEGSARYGGDEFVFEAKTVKEGIAAAKKLRSYFEENPIRVPDRAGNLHDATVMFRDGVARTIEKAEARSEAKRATEPPEWKREGRHPALVEVAEAQVDVPAFDQKKLAEDAGYTVVKKLHKTFGEAEKQREYLTEKYGDIEGQEPPVVIKTGKSYRVATKEIPISDAEAEALVAEYFKEGEESPYGNLITEGEAPILDIEGTISRIKEIGEETLEKGEESIALKEDLDTNAYIDELKSLSSLLNPDNPTHSSIIDFTDMMLDKLGPKEKTREALLKEAEVEPDATSALRLLMKAIDVVRNEKGAIEIERLSPEMQERLRKVIADSLKVGKPVKEYLKDLGYDDKTASTFEKASELFKEKRPAEELDKKVITPMEEGENVSSRKPRKVRGVEVNYVPVFYEELKTLMKSKELQERTGVGEYFRNPIRAFREAGSGLKKMVYEPYVNSEKLVIRDLKAKEATIKKLRKGISRRSAKRIWKYAMAQQEGGPAILEKMKIKKVPTSLSPKEMKAYEGLRAEYDILFDRLNEVRTSIGKNPIRKVGDYFTFMSAFSMLEKLGIKTNFVLDRPSVIRDRYAQFQATPFRFAKARAKVGMAPVITDPFVIYSRYANSAIRHIHISPIVAKVGELRRVFKLEDGSKWKLGADNQKPRLDKFLREWSNFLAGQTEFKLPPRIERGLGMINRNLTYSVLGANARSALIQISAIKNSFVELGATHTTKGLISSLKPGAERRIMKKSNLEQRVYDAVVGDAMAALKSGKIGGVKRVIASGAMWPLKYLDLRTAMATWDGAYKLAKDRFKMGEGEAIEYANDVVTRTQASALQGDLAPVQRTALGKFLTLFQTFVINDWNFLTEDVLGMKNADITNRVAVEKVLKYVAATMAVNVLFEDVLDVKSPLPTPIKALTQGIENEDSAGRIATSIFMELLEPIPVVSSARYGTSPLGPGVETLGDLTRLMRDYPLQKPWYETLGKLMGVPGTTQAMKTIRAKKRGAGVKEQIFGAKYKPKKKGGRRTSTGL